MQPGPAPRQAAGRSGFVKGANLNGPAVTIEGNPWLSHAEAAADGLVTTYGNLLRGDHAFPLQPEADADTRTMLESAVWRPNAFRGRGVSFSQRIPNGAYDVFLWMIEDHRDYYRRIDVRLEGRIVARGVGRLPLGRWKKYGPYPAAVADGRLDLEILQGERGDPALRGFAIFSAG
jgi:hypothetical protein